MGQLLELCLLETSGLKEGQVPDITVFCLDGEHYIGISEIPYANIPSRSALM